MKGDVNMTKAKKIIAFTTAMAVVCLAFGLFAWYTNKPQSESAFAASEEQVLTLQIGNPQMTVNGEAREIDPGRGTVPVLVNDARTLLPVRAVIEAVGGTVEWDENTDTTTLTYRSDVINLTIDSTTAYLNGVAQTLDVAPTTINDRTMLPIRFIAESFKFTVGWDDDTQTVTITVPADLAAQEAATVPTTAPGGQTADAPVVYMTTEITPEALVEIYDKLGFEPTGNVAIKMSTGEPPNSNYLRPELIKDLVQKVNGTIVECNTAYGGSRSETEMHKQVIEDHGLNAISKDGKADIMDEDGSMEIPVPAPANGTSTITENYVGAHLANYDSLISLAHFKGHAMAGYGGAIKNMSIGIGSSEGKCWIHSAGTSHTSPWGGDQDKFLESMGDATSAVVKQMDNKVVYINVMNRLSVDCDCDGNPAEPDMHDIGILASTDPVALDQACLDLIYAQKDGDGKSLVERIESRNGLHTLEHAAEIGLGSREYNLVSIDS